MSAKKDWSKILAFANEMISFYGREVTLAKLVKTPASPSQPWQGNQTEPDIDQTSLKTLPGVSIGRFRAAKDDFLIGLDKDFIDGLENLIVVVGNFDAKQYDVIIDRDERWRIVRTQTFEPGEVKILHFIGVVK